MDSLCGCCDMPCRRIISNKPSTILDEINRYDEKERPDCYVCTLIMGKFPLDIELFLNRLFSGKCLICTRPTGPDEVYIRVVLNGDLHFVICSENCYDEVIGCIRIPKIRPLE